MEKVTHSGFLSPQNILHAVQFLQILKQILLIYEKCRLKSRGGNESCYETNYSFTPNVVLKLEYDYKSFATAGTCSYHLSVWMQNAHVSFILILTC